MLKKLILIENGNEYQCNTKEEIVKLLLGQDYYDRSDEEKRDILKLNSTANYVVEKMNKNWNEDNEIIIEDETTYILLLLKLNKIMLLEQKESNIFTNEIDKSNIVNANYIIVNKWADELLNLYKRKGEKND